ncbi:MAG: phenylacetate-CoA ligase [Actinomycetota bacterium]|nr:phenylacetate-CoA ligase [Actinomycetota bacterium]
MTELPPHDSVYFDEEWETMSRERIEEEQLALLLDVIPYAYEHSPLVRETWDAARVHPRDVRTLDDFRERVPFIDKDAVRRFRDERGDPHGGLLCVDPAELTAIMSTSGTTGDPTLVAERWGGGGGSRPTIVTRDFWGMGLRPGDHVALVLFTFRGPMYGLIQGLGAVPVLVDYDPTQIGRLLELSIKYRPTIMYNFGGTLMGATPAAAERAGIDPKDAFSSYLSVVWAGEPLGPRARALAAEWELPLFEHTSVGDVTASFECSAHDGLHFWEDTALVEGIEPDATDHTDAVAAGDGARCELVATALTNRVAPLIRYRSDDVVRLTRERCACGRTHARMWTVGRKSDEVVVDGRPVMPIDVWGAVEAVDACALGLFQVVRPAREVDCLRLRVGYAGAHAKRADAVRDEVAGSVFDAIGIVPEIELVPDEQLLRLGPPHKIPRVTSR